MKLKKIAKFKSAALIAMGVFLGRGAQADTVIDFDSLSPANNSAILYPFGSYISATTDGITVTGFGTPNIAVYWNGIGDPATRWEYYNDSVWTAGQLNHSIVDSANDITFSPNSAAVSVAIKSFNFHPYYDFATYNERFTYDVSVLSGTNVVSGPIHITFQSDGTKNHPVSINYTGSPGQTLRLRMARVASTLGAGEVEGFAGDIAADDITFAQVPTSVQAIGPQVVFANPADDIEGAPAAISYLARITNGATTVVSSSIKLKLDGNLVTPTISSSGGLTNVSYSAAGIFAADSLHVYSLNYADNLGATYTNESVFKVISTSPVLPPSYALPLGSAGHTGFRFRSVAVNQDTTNSLDSTVSRAEAQLAGTLIDVSTSQPFTNTATLGTNSDGSFYINTVLNFNDNGTTAGNFVDDTPFPGLDNGPYNWFATEATFYLSLPVGYYRLGVNSDDGFETTVVPPQGVAGAPVVLGLFDDGRGAADTLFDFQVQQAGIYIFRVVYFESTGDASEEFFSVDIVTGDKALVNDPSNPNAIKSYRALAPSITSVSRNGSNLVLDWAYGIPPFQLQSRSDLNGTWTNLGSPTSNRTASVPISAGNLFIRVVGQP